MSTTNFVPGTVIASSWLNDVDNTVYATAINVKESTYGAVGDGVADDTAAIQAALVAAETYITSVTDPYSTTRLGRAGVYLPKGVYLVSGTLDIPGGITFFGDGKFSSVIRSSYNGPIVRAAPTTGVYNLTGTSLHNFGIIGDVAQSSQVGLSLLRPTDSAFRDIYIQKCGSDGLVVYEGLCAHFENITISQNGGTGCYVRDGIDSWLNPVSSTFPTNNCTFVNCHFAFNNGPGVKLGGTGASGLGYANNNKFLNCAIEYNYAASAEGVGNNVEDYSSAYFGNAFDGCWFESPSAGTGALQYHILKTSASASATLNLVGVKHAGNGSGSYPERFLCVTMGTVVDINSQGIGNSYRTVSGNNTPYRITKATSRLELTDPVGSTITNNVWVEDETATTTGLYNVLRQDVFGALYGPSSHRADSTDVGFEQYRTGDANAFARFNANTRAIEVGSGSSAPVTAVINNRVGISDDRGDASVTLTAGVDYTVQRFATTLTANRTVTLSTTGAVRGHKFRVTRSGLGAFTLDVGGLKTIASATAAWVDAEFDGTAWRLTGYGTL